MTQSGRRRPSHFWHPAVTIVSSLAGVIMIIATREGSPSDIRQSLLLGLAVWLPFMLILKWIMSRYVDYYAEFSLAPLNKRLSWRNILYCLPIYAGWIVLGILADRLHISLLPGGSMSLILIFLLYHEQKKIYQLAQEKIAAQEAE